MKLRHAFFALPLMAIAACAGNDPNLPAPTTPVASAPPAASGATTNPLSGPIATVTNFTIQDIQVADDDAKNQTQEGPGGDVLASTCYEQGLIPFLQQQNIVLPGQNTYKPVGIVSTFQAARDATKEAMALKTGLTPAQRMMIVKACGPLGMDAAVDITDINSVLAQIGISVLPGGGLGKLLPIQLDKRPAQ